MRPPFARVYCADWSKDPARRAVCVADVAMRRVGYVRAQRPWTLSSLIQRAAGHGGPGTLVALDAPIGVPASYLSAVAPGGDAATFLDWLPRTPAIPGYYEPARSGAEWSVHRPFFAVPRGAGPDEGGKRPSPRSA